MSSLRWMMLILVTVVVVADGKRPILDELQQELAAAGASITADADVPIIKCANPYGNPCGPAAICTDTETGFTCESMIHDDKGVCPVGCGPHERCSSSTDADDVDDDGTGTIKESSGAAAATTTSRSRCVCRAGFYRPDPHLPCVAVTNEVEEKDRVIRSQ